MKVNIVITMAGKGSRFYEAGYTRPKYEIMAHGRSLFDWSMLSLKNFLSSEARVIFVCLKDNHSSEYILQRCQALSLKDIYIHELNEVSDGQASSAYLSRRYWNPSAPLLIYNIDTYVNPNILSFNCIRAGSDGWVPCIQAPGEHWSFVKIDGDGWAIDLAEKQRISDFASIGLYWFLRADRYVEAYELFFENQANLTRGERYIAPLYRQFIQNGDRISISELPSKEVHVLGTPGELNHFLQLSPDNLQAVIS